MNLSGPVPNVRWRLDRLAGSLRRFGLTDQAKLADLLRDKDLPPAEAIASKIVQSEMRLPPSISADYVARRILIDLRGEPAATMGAEISPWLIDQLKPFEYVDVSEVRLPLFILEDTINRVFVQIFGERERQPDSPVERNDLLTAHCTIEGRAAVAAFAFNGRGKDRGPPLRIRDMGATGNQILKLVDSPADLFAIQHVNKIGEDVRKDLHLKIYALRSRGEEKAVCTFIDGDATARILRGMKQL